MNPISQYPRLTAIRQRTRFKNTLSIAEMNLACRNKFKVSKLKEEKVVKPPKKPMNTSCLKTGIVLSLDSKIPNKIPIMNDPITFTASVPCGK